MSVHYSDRPEIETDSRTAKQIQTETIYSVVKLQHEVGSLFPWRISLNDNEVVMSSDTVKLITEYIKQLKKRG